MQTFAIYHIMNQKRIHECRGKSRSPVYAFFGVKWIRRTVQETARQTEQFRELDEDSRRRLDETLQVIQQNLGEHLEVQVTITCFVPDKYKDGGSYQEYSGFVKRVDAYRRRVLLLMGQHFLLITLLIFR